MRTSTTLLYHRSMMYDKWKLCQCVPSLFVSNKMPTLLLWRWYTSTRSKMQRKYISSEHNSSVTSFSTMCWLYAHVMCRCACEWCKQYHCYGANACINIEPIAIFYHSHVWKRTIIKQEYVKTVLECGANHLHALFEFRSSCSSSIHWCNGWQPLLLSALMQCANGWNC